jgi:hypothetical protein
LAYHICCFDLLSFDDFFEKENSSKKQADENLFLWTSLFSSAPLFLEGRMRNFSSQNKCQIKAGQSNKYDITKTSGLTQVCHF